MNAGKFLIPLMAIMLLLTACSTAPQIKREQIASVNSFDGSTITYGVKGQGETAIVFIHCWTCNHQFWRPQIETFSQQQKVIWLDLAGHGLSTSKRDNYTMKAFGEDVAAVVNKVGAERVILVGHSMGGPVAIEAAELLGDKVVGVVGVDTFYTPFKYPMSEEQITGLVKHFKENLRATSEEMVRGMFTAQADPQLIQAVINQMAIADEGMAISALDDILRWNSGPGIELLEKYQTKLRNINGAPTGEEKPLHSSVVLINGVGHFPAQVKPSEFDAILDGIVGQY